MVVQEASDSLPRTLFSSLGALESSSIEEAPGSEAGNKLFTDLEAQQQYNGAVRGAHPGAWETPRGHGPPVCPLPHQSGSLGRWGAGQCGGRRWRE